MDRLIAGNTPHNIDVPNQLIESHQNASVGEVNMDESIDKEGMLETEKNERWWEAPIKELKGFQLRELVKAMKMGKKKCQIEAQRQLHGIAFPFRTLGSALAPCGARVISLYGSNASLSKLRLAPTISKQGSRIHLWC
ncbi:hypothetical protein A4A49_51401 [Nicotiana attenuata]|uniref:Uncharacterized protein n=1 Tax=Nicotiana attenuata TaxID=49451 RepID=A0A1J6HXW4_NICAT|nr:hypothetical protein A4A49_51401 [Nicotiana attenuata]